MKFYAFSLIFVLVFVCTSAGKSKKKKPAAPIKFYYLPVSPPCRAVMMTAKALGIELEMNLTNILEGEHLTPEFLKMNPQHTIPTIDDSGFILWESRAIMQYLVNAYGEVDSLYPRNPRQRAVVDQRLNFDLGTLFERYLNYYRPAFHGNDVSEFDKVKLDEALMFLNTMLEHSEFVAGDTLSIADITIIVTISNLDAFGYEIDSYRHLMMWYQRTKKALMPYDYHENEDAANTLASYIRMR